MAASLSLVTLVPLANGWPPQPPSWQKCPQFGEKELGSALLDVPSTNCLLCLMLISHPSAEDCEDHDHVRGKLLMLFRTASATTMPSRPSSGGCHHTGWMNPTKNWLQHWLWSLVPYFLQPHQGPSIPGRFWCWPPPYKGSLVGPPFWFNILVKHLLSSSSILFFYSVDHSDKDAKMLDTDTSGCLWCQWHSSMYHSS